MGVPTSEVGYTAAMPRREYHEVHKDMWWNGGKKNTLEKCISMHGPVNVKKVMYSF